MFDFETLASALVDSACAWLPEYQLAAIVGSEPRSTELAVAGLVAARLVERWDRPDGSVITLSPLGASQLGLRLVETADGEIYRWTADAVSVRTRRISRAQRRRMDDHAEQLAQVVDKRAVDPADAAAADEELLIKKPLRVPRRPFGEPRPMVMLWGHGLWPWHEDRSGPRPSVHCRECAPKPRKRKGAAAIVVSACRACGLGMRRRARPGVCPGCRGRKLSPATYCLRCDRWGLDGYFARRLGRPPKGRRPRKAG